MNYEQTLEFLFSQLPAYHRIGKAAYKGDLHNSMELDNYFGNPHRKFAAIHVAGTNGKGSVSHMIASILQEAGYKTGLYTSPHLKDFRERIKINGEMIPKEAVIDFVKNNDSVFSLIKPSFFEMTVAMAFSYFAETNIDVAVVEVGLGGRLDSTNIITPVLSVITNIGHDHMDLLGDTLRKVAREKAGIIKRSVPVVVSESQPGVSDVFSMVAAENGSSLYFADEKYHCILGTADFTDGSRQYSVTDLSSGRMYSGSASLAGDYQDRNIQAVYCSALELRKAFSISDMNIINGVKDTVKQTGLAGRWQILRHDPLVLCDTAHNKEGLEIVLGQLSRISRTNLHIVLGFVNDKDLNSVLPLFPKDARYYFTRASIPRALDNEILKREAERYGLSGGSYTDARSALAAATGNAQKSDVIFVGGSTFVVAEVI